MSEQKPQIINPPCAKCGGPHPFDMVVPSAVWNATIRAKGLPDYLCSTCIVGAFALAGQSFTAELWGSEFDAAVAIEVRVMGKNAIDAYLVSRENTQLRAKLQAIGRSNVDVPLNDNVTLHVGLSGNWMRMDTDARALAFHISDLLSDYKKRREAAQGGAAVDPQDANQDEPSTREKGVS